MTNNKHPKSKTPAMAEPVKNLQKKPSLFFKQQPIQAKLAVHHPGDVFEQEADAMADKVTGGRSNDTFFQPSLTAGAVQKKENGVMEAGADIESAISATKGSGQLLDTPLRRQMEQGFGADFSEVKIHTGDEAAALNTQLGARAFTTGQDIYFNEGAYNPQSASGKHLLAHELTHVVQQTGGAAQGIQRLAPEDVSSEMIGRDFAVNIAVTAAGITFPANTKITITKWDNASFTVEGNMTDPVSKKTILVSLDKKYLSTIGDTAAGLKQFTTNVSGAATSVKSYDKKIDDWKLKEPEYKKFKNMKTYTAELTRLETERSTTYGELNRRLIQETMYNRFDSIIKKWVDHYNTSLKPKKNLDANIVKSIIFQETRMGTSGVHLEKPPYDWTGAAGHSYPIKSRFNLGQAIDSWGPQQYLMIKEMAPAIYTKYGLSVLESKAVWKGMSNDEYAAWNSGDFVKAMVEYNAQKDITTGLNLEGSSKSDLMLDYDYWIRVLVRWLFQKYSDLGSSSWSDAVKAYNGSGTRADTYRKEVMDRIK
jgi:Domain of unknown function (DUF4157)